MVRPQRVWKRVLSHDEVSTTGELRTNMKVLRIERSEWMLFPDLAYRVGEVVDRSGGRRWGGMGRMAFCNCFFGVEGSQVFEELKGTVGTAGEMLFRS